MSAFKTALACVGAMMGAGFASGREMYLFFSSYGAHSWILLVVAVLMMMILCFLVLSATTKTQAIQWTDMYQTSAPWIRWCLRFCVGLLLLIVGAGMVSASGHLCMLVGGYSFSYGIGSVGTLLVAWLLSKGQLRSMTWISAVLAFLFVVLHACLLGHPTQEITPLFPTPSTIHTQTWLRTIGYASMNITLSIGVISKPTKASKVRITVYFGAMMGILLLISNALYQQSTFATTAFPIVQLLTDQFGYAGFLLSALLLYLAVLTTLVAVLCGLTGILSVPYQARGQFLIFCALLLISQIGFEGIVTWLYAPIGWLCMAFVFAPLLLIP